MIDWQKVCLNLRSNYKPLATGAREIGAKDKHLCDLARGEVMQPRFLTGVKLLDLHYDVMGDRHKEAMQ